MNKARNKQIDENVITLTGLNSSRPVGLLQLSRVHPQGKPGRSTYYTVLRKDGKTFPCLLWYKHNK